jgi:hypothetical protein
MYKDNVATSVIASGAGSTWLMRGFYTAFITSTTFSDIGVTLQSSGTNLAIVWTVDGGTTQNGRAA